MIPVEYAVKIEGGNYIITQDNTTVVMFDGDDVLDHVHIKLEGEDLFVYHRPFLDKLCEWGYPAYVRFDRPTWAVERYMQSGAQSIDKLLAQAGDES